MIAARGESSGPGFGHRLHLDAEPLQFPASLSRQCLCDTQVAHGGRQLFDVLQARTKCCGRLCIALGTRLAETALKLAKA